MIKKISLSLSVLVACSNHPVKATRYTKKCITTAIVATSFLTKNSQKHAPATMARYRNHHMPPKVHTAHLPYVSFLHCPKPTSHFYNGSTTSSTSKASLPIIAALGLCTGMGVYAGANYDTTALCAWGPWFPVTSYSVVGSRYCECGLLYIQSTKVKINSRGQGWGTIEVAKRVRYEKQHKFIVKIKVRKGGANWVTIAQSPILQTPSFAKKEDLPVFYSFNGPPARAIDYKFEFNVNDVPDHVNSSSDLGVSIHDASWWW